jgi:hypothetical protein
MKRSIKLSAVEFYHFRQVAFKLGVVFMCGINNAVYTIEANSDALEQIGY